MELDAAVAADLGEAVIASYLQGLRDAGWIGDANLVRLGYAAHAVLRWGFLPGWALAIAADEAQRRQWTARLGRPVEPLLESWGRITAYLLQLCDLACTLAARVTA
jgi:hypothetical protein